MEGKLLDKNELASVEESPDDSFVGTVTVCFQLTESYRHFVLSGLAGEHCLEDHINLLFRITRFVNAISKDGELVSERFDDSSIEQIQCLRNGGVMSGVLDYLTRTVRRAA